MITMKPNYLSASRITQYLMRPLKYRLQYVDKVNWDFHPANMALGSSVHAAIESFYRTWIECEKMSATELIDLFQGFWKGETEGKSFEPDCDPDAIKHQGIALLEAFARDVQPAEVISVEDQFKLYMILSLW